MWDRASGGFGLTGSVRSLDLGFGIRHYAVPLSCLKVERRIIEDVASYGRQLGRIMEALDVVIGHLHPGERTDLTAGERQALQDFSDLVRQVQALKGDSGPPRLTVAELDRMLDDLRALKHQDPPAYERIADRLREVISD